MAGRAFHETTQKMSESRILVRLLRMYFPRNWEFGSALSKLRNFRGGGFERPKPPLGSMPLAQIHPKYLGLQDTVPNHFTRDILSMECVARFHPRYPSLG